MLGAYSLAKRMNPPEYGTEEEEQKANVRFGLWDLFARYAGAIRALRES